MAIAGNREVCRDDFPKGSNLYAALTENADVETQSPTAMIIFGRALLRRFAGEKNGVERTTERQGYRAALNSFDVDIMLLRSFGESSSRWGDDHHRALAKLEGES